jgi:chromosome segregation ATPase
MTYSLEELRDFEEKTLGRIRELESRLEDLEDEMNSGDEQIEISDRIEALLAKFYRIGEAIANHDDLRNLAHD